MNTITYSNRRLKKYKKSGRSVSVMLQKEKSIKERKNLLNYKKDKNDLISSMQQYIDYATYKIATLKTISFVIKDMYNEEHEDFKTCSSYIETLQNNINSFKDTIDICSRKPDHLNIQDASDILDSLCVSVLTTLTDATEFETNIQELENKYKEDIKRYIIELYKGKEDLLSAKPMEFIEDTENNDGETEISKQEE